MTQRRDGWSGFGQAAAVVGIVGLVAASGGSPAGCGRPAPGLEGGDGGGTRADAGPGLDAGAAIPTRPAALCAPAPAPLGSAVAPELRAWVLEAEAAGCRLERVARDGDGDGVVDETLELPEPAGRQCRDAACASYEETLPAQARAWTERGPYGAEHWRAMIGATRVVEGGVERLGVTLEGRTDGSTATQRLERVYDGQGRLLSERHLWNGALWTEVTNAVEGGRLVASARNDLINGTGLLQVTYGYDAAGRLAEVRQEDPDAPGTPAQGARLTYDAEGRVARVERTLGGQRFLEQEWDWDGARLAERRVTVHRDADGAWPSVALDDHAPLALLDPWFEQRWDDALFVAKGECALPPRSIAHGYPRGEGIWELGWPKEERPWGIGFDYGYDGYAYYYGDQAWFGHGGVGVLYAGYGWGREERLTLRYDRWERLLEEELASTAEGSGERILRERVYAEGAGEGAPGPAVEDVLAVERTAPGPGGEPVTQRFGSRVELGWEGGRLTGRRWVLDDLEAARHGWSYDGSGRLSSHTVAYDRGLFTSAGLQSLQPPPAGHAPDWLAVEWRQTYSEDGLEMVRERYVEGVPSGEEERWSRRAVPGGLLVSRSGSFELVDDAGRVIAHGYGDYSDPSYVYRRSLDAAGRLEAWSYLDTQAGRRESEAYTHVCQ